MSKVQEIVSIEIPNWDKYNPRKDIKRMSFFRLEADIFEDQKFFSLGHLDKVLLLFIYTRCCKQGSGKTSVNIRQASAMTSIRVDHVRAGINRLEKNQLLIKKSVTDTLPRLDKTRQDKTRQDKTRENRSALEVVEVDKGALSPKIIFDLWQELCAETFHKIQKLTPQRQDALKNRIKIYSEKSDWEKAFQKILKSDFCRGKNENGWKATFDWILRPDTLVKILEGKYDNRKLEVVSPQKKTFAQMRTEKNQQVYEELMQELEEKGSLI